MRTHKLTTTDGCPYRRPFPEQFRDCPTYVAERFEVTTMRGQPLEPIWTCHFLAIGAVPDQLGHLYPRCELGDLASRRGALLQRLRPTQAA